MKTVLVFLVAVLLAGGGAWAQEYGLPPGFSFDEPLPAGGPALVAAGPMDDTCVAARIWCDDALTTDPRVVLTPTVYVVDETTTCTTATLVLYSDYGNGIYVTSFTLPASLTIGEIVTSVSLVSGWRAEIQAALAADALGVDDGSSETTTVVATPANSTSATLCRTVGTPIIWDTSVAKFHRVALGPEQVTPEAPRWVVDFVGALRGQSGLRDTDASGAVWTASDYVTRLRYLRAGATRLSTATLAVYAGTQDTAAGGERLVQSYAVPASGVVVREALTEDHGGPGERYIVTFGGEEFRGAILEVWGWVARRE